MPVCMLAALVVALPVLAYSAAGVIGDIAPGLLPSPMPHTYLFAAWAVSGLLAVAVVYVFYALAVRFAGEIFRQTDA